MKTMMRTLKWGLGAALFAVVFASLANAQCISFSMSKRSSSLLKPQLLSQMTSPAAFAPVADVSAQDRQVTSPDPIVGMWYVKFTSYAAGVFFDWGYNSFHSDGTEILNSGTGARKFCTGVWEKTGTSQYEVNHFAIGYTYGSSPQFIGIVNLRERINIGSGSNRFTGTFTLGIYDQDGNLLEPPLGPGTVNGRMEGHRITVDTPPTDVLPAPAPAP